MTQTDKQDKMIQSVTGIVMRCMQQSRSARETIRAALEYEIALKGMYFDFKPFLDELRSGKPVQP
jgi:isocitrate dehydrogenase